MGAAVEPRSRFRPIVEGVAIVVSILLAFAIEAGWDEVQERREEQEVLVGLRRDFLSNQAQLSDVGATHRSRSKVYSWFRNARPADVRAVAPDSVDALYGGLWAPHTFDAARSSIDALIGAGKFDVIQDRGLRDQLTSFLNLVDDLGEESERMQSSSAAVLEGTIPHGGPWRDANGPSAAFSDLPNVSADNLASLRADSVLMGWIGLAHQYSSSYLQDVEALAVAVEDVLARLEIEIR